MAFVLGFFLGLWWGFFLHFFSGCLVGFFCWVFGWVPMYTLWRFALLPCVPRGAFALFLIYTLTYQKKRVILKNLGL
jgi:hypothetical protein